MCKKPNPVVTESVGKKPEGSCDMHPNYQLHTENVTGSAKTWLIAFPIANIWQSIT